MNLFIRFVITFFFGHIFCSLNETKEKLKDESKSSLKEIYKRQYVDAKTYKNEDEFVMTFLNKTNVFIPKEQWSSWSQCSTLCGEGIRSRKLVCVKSGDAPPNDTQRACRAHQIGKTIKIDFDYCNPIPCPEKDKNILFIENRGMSEKSSPTRAFTSGITSPKSLNEAISLKDANNKVPLIFLMPNSNKKVLPTKVITTLIAGDFPAKKEQEEYQVLFVWSVSKKDLVLVAIITFTSLLAMMLLTTLINTLVKTKRVVLLDSSKPLLRKSNRSDSLKNQESDQPSIERSKKTKKVTTFVLPPNREALELTLSRHGLSNIMPPEGKPTTKRNANDQNGLHVRYERDRRLADNLSKNAQQVYNANNNTTINTTNEVSDHSKRRLFSETSSIHGYNNNQKGDGNRGNGPHEVNKLFEAEKFLSSQSEESTYCSSISYGSAPSPISS